MTIPCSLVLSATTRYNNFSFFLPLFLSFFLSFLVWLLLPTHCRCRGLLLRLITFTHKLRSTPLDERSARRRDLYLTTNNTPKRQISMPPGGFESAIPASERPQACALDRAATGTDRPTDTIPRFTIVCHQSLRNSV
jgi:hypothetical protein